MGIGIEDIKGVSKENKAALANKGIDMKDLMDIYLNGAWDKVDELPRLEQKAIVRTLLDNEEIWDGVDPVISLVYEVSPDASYGHKINGINVSYGAISEKVGYKTWGFYGKAITDITINLTKNETRKALAQLVHECSTKGAVKAVKNSINAASYRLKVTKASGVSVEEAGYVMDEDGLVNKIVRIIKAEMEDI